MSKCCSVIQVDFTSLNIVSHTILTHLTDCYRQSHCPQQQQKVTGRNLDQDQPCLRGPADGQMSEGGGRGGEGIGEELGGEEGRGGRIDRNYSSLDLLTFLNIKRKRVFKESDLTAASG